MLLESFGTSSKNTIYTANVELNRLKLGKILENIKDTGRFFFFSLNHVYNLLLSLISEL